MSSKTHATRAQPTAARHAATPAPAAREHAPATSFSIARVPRLPRGDDAPPENRRGEPEAPAASPGTGKPLPPALRAKMEAAFQTPLDDVRVHEGHEARRLGALAYTQGRDIHFQPGQYDPRSASGQALLGHELAHVVQQRAGRVALPQGKGAPINADASLEREADIMGARAARGEAAHVTGATSAATGAQAKPEGAPIQRWPWSKKKPFTPYEPTLLPAEETSYERGEGGTASDRVDKVSYLAPIGASGSKKGYFKPETANLPFPAYQANILPDPQSFPAPPPANVGDAKMSTRAVLSSRLDKRLGLGVLANEYFAERTDEQGNKEEGVVSAHVGDSYTPLQRGIFEGPVVDKATRDRDPAAYKPQQDGTYRGLSAMQRADVDYSDPQLQKKLSDLQLLDMLTGQVDRHAGNIFVDPARGDVKGIDNDVAFGRRAEGVNHNMGLPNMIDKDTAKRFTKLSKRELRKLLQVGGGKDIKPEEVEAAVARLEKIKAHVKGLRKKKQLVGQKGGTYRRWGEETFNAQLHEGESYLRREHEEKTRAAAPGGHGLFQPGAAPAPAAPAAVPQAAAAQEAIAHEPPVELAAEPAAPALAPAEVGGADLAVPEPAPAEVAAPEPAAPEMAASAAAPEVAASEVAAPEVAAPDVAAPEPMAPQLAEPEPAAPQVAAEKPAAPSEPASPRTWRKSVENIESLEERKKKLAAAGMKLKR